MSREFNYEADPFRAFAEYGGAFEQFEGESAAGRQGEVNRGSSDYIRWVQQSLNKVMGLRLSVDGRMGAQTRSAIRSFQQRSGLSADGQIGAQTERALVAAGAGPPPGAAPGPPVPGPPAPLGPNELLQVIRPREALKSATNVPIQFNLVLPLMAQPQISLAKAEGNLTGFAETGVSQLRLVVQRALGQLALPPPIPVTSLAQLSAATSDSTSAQAAGFLPDHLPSRPLPRPMPSQLKAKPRIHVPLPQTRPQELYEPTTVFPPEDRRIFQDTAYPWCTVGRVDTPGGTCSGAMVGPRHMLTCSHGIQWNSDGTAGWVKFTPAYFDGAFPPFGDAMGTRVYSMKKVDGSDGIDRDEGRSDYVVVILNSRLGDVTGWMGSRSYSDSWDDQPFWSHIGYPADLTSAKRPTFQASISLDGAFFDSDSRKRIFHQGDVWPGQSGGPFFGWWKGESYPSVVAVQSAQDSSENLASGGSDLVTLISKARADFP